MWQSPWRSLLLVSILFLAMAVISTYTQRFTVSDRGEIHYSLFRSELAKGNIRAVTLKGGELRGDFAAPVTIIEAGQSRQIRSFTTFMPSIEDSALLAELQAKGVDVTAERADGPTAMSVFFAILPWLLIFGVWWFVIRGMRAQGPGGVMGGFSRSGAKLYSSETNVKVTFDDVAGMANAKAELTEVVEFLRDPKRFQRIGGKVPHGVLLVGPPGTGKTLLARAVAGEAGVPFFTISASQFIEMFVGVGASRVRDLFATARKSTPSIIFIDELDAVGRSRGAGFGGGHDEREQTLNQLLSEMDGFESHEEIIVLAATNRPDVLDPALLRPGRFDRHVVVERPDWRDREQILRVHTRKIPLDKDVELSTIARGTPGMTGADLENLVNEAAILAARENAPLVTNSHLERAKDKILMGGERKMVISDHERRITAFHEAGHALVAKLLPGTDPVHKVTIIPRGQALGATLQLPDDDRYHYPKSYLMNRLAVALGGRVAERVVFADLSTGAQNDLKMVNDLAEKMVCQWGMSERLGAMTFSRGEEHPFLGRKLAEEKSFSEQSAATIDEEISAIIRAAEAQAEELLLANREKLNALAEALVQEETLDARRVDDIVAGI